MAKYSKSRASEKGGASGGRWSKRSDATHNHNMSTVSTKTGGTLHASGSLQLSPSTSRFAGLKHLGEEGFSQAEIYRLVAPRRTLERRFEKKQPLSAVEADRVARLERIVAHAVRVFGSAEKAHRWLRKPCRALDGAVPIDLLATETGAHLVEDELHAIDYGMFV